MRLIFLWMRRSLPVLLALPLWMLASSCRTGGSTSDGGATVKSFAADCAETIRQINAAAYPIDVKRNMYRMYEIINTGGFGCRKPLPREDYSLLVDPNFLRDFALHQPRLMSLLTAPNVIWTKGSGWLNGWIERGPYLIDMYLEGSQLSSTHWSLGSFHFTVYHNKSALAAGLPVVLEALHRADIEFVDHRTGVCRSSGCFPSTQDAIGERGFPLGARRPGDYECRVLSFPGYDLLTAVFPNQEYNRTKGECWRQVNAIYQQAGLPMPLQ